MATGHKCRVVSDSKVFIINKTELSKARQDEDLLTEEKNRL